MSDNPKICVTRVAGGDLSGKQYYGVKLDSSEQVVIASAAGERIFGILQNDPAAGEAATVLVFGRSNAKIGSGGLTTGGMPKVLADGKFGAAVASTMDTTSASASDPLVGSYVVGHVMKGGAENEIGEILFTPMGAVPSTAA